MPKIHMVEKNEATEKYWIVTYENPSEHYNEETYHTPYSKAKTPGEAFWWAMYDIDALHDEDEMLDCYPEFDNINDLRKAVIAFVDDPKSAIAQRCPDNIQERHFIDAELVQKVSRGKKR